jgi:hypothetical protein
MPGTFSSTSIFAFDLDERGRPGQAWETVVDGAEAKAIEEAKGWHCSTPECSSCDATEIRSLERKAIVVYRSGKTDGFD